MWFHPRKTIQAVVEFSPNYGLKILAFIYGIASLFSLAQTFSLGFYMGIVPLMLLILIVAPFWGYLVFTFVSWVVYQTGRWIKGQGSHHEVRAVLAWSHIPITVNLLIWAVFLCIFGGALFQSFPGTYLLKGPMFYLLFALSLGQFFMGVWSLVLYLSALAQVQKFSLAKAVANLLIAGVVFAAAFSLISLLFMWGSHLAVKSVLAL
jgi:hypothetical protein